jgi:hypothetical protein
MLKKIIISIVLIGNIVVLGNISSAERQESPNVEGNLQRNMRDIPQTTVPKYFDDPYLDAHTVTPSSIIVAPLGMAFGLVFGAPLIPAMAIGMSTFHLYNRYNYIKYGNQSEYNDSVK